MPGKRRKTSAAPAKTLAKATAGAISRADQVGLTQATYNEWIQGTITPSEVARRWTRRTKPRELATRYIGCPTVSYCADLVGSVLASYTPRMYAYGTDLAGRKGIPRGSIRAKRVENPKLLANLKSKDMGLRRRSGKGLIKTSDAAEYAEEAGSEIYEITRHPFLDLLRNPNRRETRFGYWACEWVCRQIFGNSYALVTMDDGEFPAELFHMFPQYVTPGLSDESFIDSYLYWVYGGAPPQRYAADDVWHTYWMQSPFSNWDGKGWLENCIPHADDIVSMLSVEGANYENNCLIQAAVLLENEGTTNDQAKQLAEQINSKHQGTRNAGKLLMLRGARDIKPLQFTSKDDSWMEKMKAHETAVRNAAGVPEAFANLNQANLASALQADTVFYSTVIQPQMLHHLEFLTNFVCHYWGHKPGEVWLACDNIVESNYDQISDQTQKEYEAGILTLDEARQEIGRNPIGDERGSLFSFENAARATAEFAPSPSPIGQSGTVAPEKQSDNPFAKPAKQDDQKPPPEPKPKPEGSANDKAQGPDPAPQVKTHDVPGVPRDPYSELLDAVHSWLSDSVNSGEYSKAALTTAIQGPIANLYQTGGIAGIDKLKEQGYDVTGLPGAQMNAANASFEVLPQHALDALQNYTGFLAQTVTTTRIEETRTAVADALAQGLTSDEATERVHQVMAERTRDDAERIARTESSRAYNAGSVQAWRGLGVEKKRWQLANDSCPICTEIAKLNPDPIPVDQAFVKGGQSVPIGGGKSYTFTYGDVDHPPGHPHCRCTVIPVLEGQP